MDPRAFLRHLETDPDAADSLVHVRELAGAQAGRRAVPRRSPRAARRPGSGLTGVRGLYPHQSDGLAALAGGPRRGDGHRHRERQDPRVQRGVRRDGDHHAEGHRALPVPDEGARARPAAVGARAEAAAGQGRGLRRRHAEGGAPADPHEREPRDDEPRHAAPVAARRPRALGRLLPAAVARGRRRGPRVPRRVRLARRDGAAPAPAPRRALRRHPAVVPRERDRRQSGRARDPAHRASTTSSRSPTTPRRGREALRPVEPTARRRGDRRAAQRARGERRGSSGSSRAGGPARSGSHDRVGPRSCSPSGRGARSATRSCGRRSRATGPGYLAEDRRRIERALADGELLAVASTSALELGIDIGSLDAAVLTGYPGTRAAMWQQAGRAGRRDTDSLAVLVAQDDPLDQYLVHHPEDLFDKPAEAAVIDPTNPYVREPHLRCAAREVPLRDDELAFFGDAAEVRASVEAMTERGRARASPGGLARSRQGRAPPCGRRAGRRRPRLLDRDRRHRRTAGHGRRASGLRHAPPGRRLPAPRRAVPRAGARPRVARRGRSQRRPRLLHAGARRHRHRRRRDTCAVEYRRRRAVLRNGARSRTRS